MSGDSGLSAAETSLLLLHMILLIRSELWEILCTNGSRFFMIDIHRNARGEGLMRHKSLIGVPGQLPATELRDMLAKQPQGVAIRGHLVLQLFI